MRVVSVVNQKGGVGKSTTALALGAGLKEKGYKVLFVDLDQQGNLTYVLKGNPSGLTSYDLFKHSASIKEVIQKVEAGDMVPSSPLLSAADKEFTDEKSEYIIREALKPISDAYDYVVIDTPPALGMITANALTASNTLIIPAEADILSLQGIGHLYNTFETIKTLCNPGLSVTGILLTRFNNRTILSRDMMKMIKDTAKQFDTTLFDISIRESIIIKEAHASRKSIFAYSSNSNVATDYMAFVYEFLEREGMN